MDAADSGGVVLVSIKRIFTDFEIDCEYAVALSYRMVRGDRMIMQMWEPHQTSGFLNAFFIAIYLFVTGTTTGIVLYLNVVGLAVKLGVAYVFYRTFCKTCSRNLLFLMCTFFLAVNAKNSIILEFSNMMIYFSILLLCTLFLHLKKGNHSDMRFLVLAAVCFCLEVLSYPSVIILFPLLLLILHHYSETKARDMLLFTGICVFAGGAFLIYLMAQGGWQRFWECIRIITTGDSSHEMGDFADRLKIYFADLREMAVLYAVCALLAVFKVRLSGKKGEAGKECYVKSFFMLLLFFDFMLAILADGDNSVTRHWLLYLGSYPAVSLLAFGLRKYCGREERMAYLIGMTISITGCAAVLLLTNLTLMTTLAYLILGIMVSMIPIGGYLRQKSPNTESGRTYGLVILFIAVCIFRNIYVIRLMSSMYGYGTIGSIAGVVREGPEAGIFLDYMGAYTRNSNLSDWRQLVRKGDRILIVGSLVSTIGYLYEDTEICVDSTICTPTYDEKLLTYWEMNPWKEPNVVVLDCWFGELRIHEDEWIMKWIGEHFDSYVDGHYVRVYRRE